jgi:glycosyltransferase involved in cell wall biosynthesis
VTAFNEERNLKVLIESFLALIETNGLIGDLILVDNGSTDGSATYLNTIDHNRVHQIKLFPNVGYGGGVKAAISHSFSDFVVIIPADNQYLLADVSSLIDAFARINVASQDLVLLKGKRIGRTDPRFVRFLSFFYSTLASLLIGQRISDVNGLPKIFNKNYASAFLSHLPNNACLDAALLLEMSLKKIKIVEVPIAYHNRTIGQASWAKRKLLTSIKMFITIVGYRLRR